ncbi:MFS transporter [Caviibacter abscessus]|uniref:MFS transporter n=1 Tax=Caviibacter abscessus TaxID=1766719 RepID=UPI0012E3BC25|nr:MFS transporter [Caviibacter abscessus]
MAISIVTVSETLPPFFSVYTGYLVDRTKNKAFADIVSNLLRFIIYVLVAIVLYIYNGITTIIIISILNILSDLIGSYSDNLRFPIIYSIIPEEDMEESFSFSNITYYIFSFGAKVFGGIILLLLGSNFITFSILNSITFLVAGLMMIHIFSDLRFKILEYEKNLNQDNENNNDIKIFRSILRLLKNKKIMKVLLPVSLSNSLVACLLSFMYVYINNPKILSQLPYETIISLLGGISVIGIIVGNWASTRYFKSFSIFKSLNFMLIILGMISFLLFTNSNIYILLIFIFILFGFEGILSPQFSLYLMENQDYDSLGVSSGAINTLLAVTIPVQIFIVLTSANIFGLWFSEILLFVFVITYLALVNRLDKKYED